MLVDSALVSVELGNSQYTGGDMKRCWKHGGRFSLCACVFALVATLIVSCGTLQNVGVLPPVIEGATYVGDDVCADCHEDTVKKFAASVHKRMVVEGAEVETSTGCEACHGAGSKHVDAADSEKAATIFNPGKSSDACYRCHFDTEVEFNLPYSHPVKQGKMKCADCHDPHGANARKPGRLAIARANDTCRQCHKDQTRQHAFEHEAVRDGCINCHRVHGSIHRAMLVENDVTLCLKCHAQVQRGSGTAPIGDRDHASYFGRSTCWGAGCHTAVHGSNVDSHLRY